MQKYLILLAILVFLLYAFPSDVYAKRKCTYANGLGTCKTVKLTSEESLQSLILKKSQNVKAGECKHSLKKTITAQEKIMKKRALAVKKTIQEK